MKALGSGDCPERLSVVGCRFSVIGDALRQPITHNRKPTLKVLTSIGNEMRPRRQHPRDSERGLALISALWLTAVLSALLYSFAASMTTQMRIASNYVDQVIALELAKSGLERAIAELKNDSESDDEADSEDDDWFGSEDDFREVDLGVGTYSLIHGTLGMVRPDLANEVAFGIGDEGGKLDLNKVTRAILIELPALADGELSNYSAEEIADAIIDWHDEDDEPGESGAETNEYQFADAGYVCKNAPFETVEELLLVRGVTKKLLYGEDTNRNGVLDPNENDGDATPPHDDGDGVLDRGLIDFVTVYSSESTGTSEQAGTTQQSQASVTFNVNTASAAVLTALPGVDEDTADKIVEVRSTITDRTSTDWVADVEGVGAATYQSIQGYLATKSDVFVVDSVGRVAGKPVFRRIRAVLRRTDGNVRVLYWRDVTSLGPPFRLEDDSNTDMSGAR